MAKEVECMHLDCGKVWLYKGDNKINATCPDCGRKTAIRKAGDMGDDE